jgi:hypothetical protein
MKMQREHLLLNTELSFDDLDKQIIAVACNQGYPQTPYQLTNFVSKSHPTLYRQLHQTFLEVETREHSLSKMDINKKKFSIQLRQKQKEYDECTDELEKELIQVEMEDIKIDIRVTEKKLKMAREELRVFLDFIRQYCSTPEEIEQAIKPNPEEEHKYWIARMAKQSAVDVLTQGRIGPGNLDSILMMDEKDQLSTMQLALDYSSSLGVGLHNLRLNSEDRVKGILEGKQIPSETYLENVVTGYDRKEMLQPSYKPETGTRILTE